MDDQTTIFLILISFAGLWMITQPWFWAIAGFIGGLFALFSMIASIIHFQIFPAIGFFFMAAICYAIVSVAAE